MRFYFEDCAGGNVATKCLRFCSNASTSEVVETLAEKFRPDMKMLSTCHSLYEIHGSKGETPESETGTAAILTISAFSVHAQNKNVNWIQTRDRWWFS